MPCHIAALKELVYRYVKQGDKLIENLKARMLSFVFNGNKITGTRATSCANRSLLSRASFMARPKAEKSYLLSLRIIISPYVLQFTSRKLNDVT